MRSAFALILLMVHIGRANLTSIAALSDMPLILPASELRVEGLGTLRELPPILTDFTRLVDPNAKVFALRISAGGNTASKLYIRNMALSIGAKLYLYGINAKRSITKRYGPFEGTGPLQSGEFWTGAIEGSEIVVELQVGAPNSHPCFPSK